MKKSGFSSLDSTLPFLFSICCFCFLFPTPLLHCSLSLPIMLSLPLEHHILEAKTLSPYVSVKRCMLLWHLADARMPEQQNTFNMPKFAYENLSTEAASQILSITKPCTHRHGRWPKLGRAGIAGGEPLSAACRGTKPRDESPPVLRCVDTSQQPNICISRSAG